MARTTEGGITLVDMSVSDVEGQLNNFTLADLAKLVAGRDAVNVAGSGAYSLGAVVESDKRTLVCVFFGALTGDRTIYWPQTESGALMLAVNSTTGAYKLTVTTDAPGPPPSVTVPQGHFQILFRNLGEVYGSRPFRLGSAGKVDAVSLRRGTNQSIPDNGAYTTIAFDTPSSTANPAGMWSAGSPSRVTAPWTGWYDCKGAAEFAANASGRRVLGLRVNGVDPPVRVASQTSGSGTNPIHLQAAATLYLGAGDYVELAAFQNSGGALNVTASSFSPCLEVVYLGL